MFNAINDCILHLAQFYRSHITFQRLRTGQVLLRSLRHRMQEHAASHVV
jgi:hypothetical protein